MNELENQIALQRLMGRYVDAANRRDAEQWISTWAPDGRWSLMGMGVEGREQILGFWQQVLAGFEFAILMPSSRSYSIDGDTATGHWYLQEFTRDLKGERMFALSRYTDAYRRIEGEWLFQSREYQFLYQGAPDLTGNFLG